MWPSPTALLDYDGFDEAGLNVIAGFDLIPPEDAQERGKPIYPMEQLKEFCAQQNIHVGIIAVPADCAQDVCDMLVKCGVEDVEGLDENPLACAYVRARGTDRMCSFGDWVALSEICDELTASLIAPEVSDGIIAPGYTDKALEILKTKRKGSYNVVAIDSDYKPAERETKEIFGISFHL